MGGHGTPHRDDTTVTASKASRRDQRTSYARWSHRKKSQRPQHKRTVAADLAPFKLAVANQHRRFDAIQVTSPYIFDHPDWTNILATRRVSRRNTHPSKHSLTLEQLSPSHSRQPEDESSHEVTSKEDKTGGSLVLKALCQALDRHSSALRSDDSTLEPAPALRAFQEEVMRDYASGPAHARPLFPLPSSDSTTAACPPIPKHTFARTPAQVQLPYYSLRPTASRKTAVPQRAQSAFVYLEFSPHADMDGVFSSAASVTDDREEWFSSWVPTAHWLLKQQHHMSVTRVFWAQRRELSPILGVLNSVTQLMQAPHLQFKGFDALTDERHRILYLVALVTDQCQAPIVQLSQGLEQRLVKELSMPPPPYFEDKKYHVSILSARLDYSTQGPNQVSVASEQTQASSPFREARAFDRGPQPISNANLLLRQSTQATTHSGPTDGLLPPYPGVPPDQSQVVRAAELRAGQALRSLDVIRPAALCLRLGRRFFRFPFRK